MGKVHVHSHFQPFVHFATDVGTQCITGKTGLFDNTILIQEVTGEGMPSFFRTAAYTQVVFLRKAVLINQVLPVGSSHPSLVAVFIGIITRITVIFRRRQVFAVFIIQCSVGQ